MTKRNENPGALTPGNDESGKETNTNISVLHSDKITQQNNGMITLIRGNIVLVYWLSIYRDLGLKRQHADDIINKLVAGTHYIKLTRDEIKPLLDSVASAATPAVKAYYFLTDEGWNRALIEINTDPMLNREAADFIEATKDKMAAVFTRYQKGEVLSLTGEPQKQFSKFVPGAGVLRDFTRQAKTYQRLSGCSLKQSLLRCIEKADTEHRARGGCGFPHLIELTNEMPESKHLLLPAQVGLYLSVTKIGKGLGKSGQKVNKYLDLLGYQESVGSDHTPTEIGIPYSRWEEISIETNDKKIVKQTLIWSVEIIDILRVHIEAEQATLPGCLS